MPIPTSVSALCSSESIHLNSQNRDHVASSSFRKSPRNVLPPFFTQLTVPTLAFHWGYYAFPLAWAAAEGDADLVNRLLACHQCTGHL